MKKIVISLLALSSLLLSGLAQAEGSVARAIITTAVVDHEPINDLDKVLAGNEKVMLFTELRGMTGQTIKHRWSHGGEVMGEVGFKVGGPRWRVWSSKNLLPEWAGEWSVEVLDGEGNVLSTKQFSFAGDGMPAPESVVKQGAPIPTAEPGGKADVEKEKAPAADKAVSE